MSTYLLFAFAPTNWQHVAVSGTSIAATAIADSSGVAPIKIWLKADTKTHIQFGTSIVGAATTSMGYVTADADVVLDIPPGVTHFRAITPSASGTLFWAYVA